jgi:hypothetical protein
MKARRPKFYNLTQDEWSQADYDLSVFALGFESRAINLLKSVQDRTERILALGFDHGHELAYAGNQVAFEAASAKIENSLSDQEFERVLQSNFSLLSREIQQTIFVDVSCFSRFRLAAVVHIIFSMAASFPAGLTIDFAYSVARFEKPKATRQPNTVVGPAHYAFAGWSQGGYSSTAAVLGLGYEQDQALGAVEYLQAGEVWAFTPNSPVLEYKPEVELANELLLSELPPSRVLQYEVCAPKSVIAVLESVVRGLSDSHSVVMVPFGPKIFVLCSLIVAALRDDLAVWRVSQGSTIKAHDRMASDVTVGLRVSFPAENPNGHVVHG